VIVTFFFLSRVEHTFGWLKTFIIYILSGIAANIFRAVITKSDIPSAGASTSLYGIIGVIIGYIILNWNGLDLLGPMIKCQVFCSAFMIIIFIFIFTPTSGSNIDFYGHLGGFLSGLWLSAIHKTIVSGKCETVTRSIFVSLFIIQVLVCLLVLYLTPK
jgi:rhomboid protease GluP